jgi:hypothetical protein
MHRVAVVSTPTSSPSWQASATYSPPVTVALPSTPLGIRSPTSAASWRTLSQLKSDFLALNLRRGWHISRQQESTLLKFCSVNEAALKSEK